MDNITSFSSNSSKNLEIKNCIKSDAHAEYQLNQICVNLNCSNFLEPVCVQCIEEQKNHIHETGFKSLKSFIQSISDLLNQEIQIESQKAPKSSQVIQNEWFMTYKEHFRKLQAKITTVIQNIDAMEKFFIESAGQDNDSALQQRINHPTTKVISQILEQVNNQTNNQEMLTFQLKRLSPLLTLKNGQLAFSDPPTIQNSKEIFRRLQVYQNNIKQQFDTLEKNIDSAIKNSILSGDEWIALQKQTIETNINNKISWHFIPSQYENSKNLTVTKNNTRFQGADGMMGVIYSSKSFFEGKHYFKLKMNQLEISSTKLYIGLIPEEEKDRQPGMNNPHQFLFGESGNHMIKLTDKFLGDVLREGDYIKVILDFKRNNFYVRDQKGNPFYEINEEFPLKGKKWRFTVFGRWRDLQVELIESE